jgi:hypothetical protein
MFDEARTEVDLAVQEAQKNRRFLGKRLRALISEEWYPKAKYLGSNESLYRKHLFRADQFLDGDLGIDRVLVEFVNSKRKMLHFISMDGRAGFLQYGRLTPKVSIGDILEIRFKGALQSGLNHAVFIRPVTTDLKNNTFFKHIHGTLRFDSRSTYGKIGDVSVHPSLIRGFHLADGMQVEGIAIRYHHKVKGEIGWKAHVLSRISPERV